MTTRTVLSLVLTLLAACATTGNYEKILHSWVGHSEVELVRVWGPPRQAYDAGGHKFLLYSSQGSFSLPGTSPVYTTNVVGNTAYTTSSGGSAPINIALSCVTTFELADDRVIRWSWKGNNCVATD